VLPPMSYTRPPAWGEVLCSGHWWPWHLAKVVPYTVQQTPGRLNIKDSTSLWMNAGRSLTWLFLWQIKCVWAPPTQWKTGLLNLRGSLGAGVREPHIIRRKARLCPKETQGRGEA
jgi:hypothetical protein